MTDRRLEDRDLLVALLDEYGSDAAVAAELEVDRSTVTRWRDHHGIESRSATGRSAPAKARKVLRDEAALAALVAEVGTFSAAAEQLGVTDGTVRYYVRVVHKLDVDVPSEKDGRPRVGGGVLEDRDRLAALLSAHPSRRAAAEAAGVSLSTLKRRIVEHGLR